MLDRAEQVDQRSPKPVNGPSHQHVELAPTGILYHSVEPGPLVATLGAANAGVAVGLDHRPATTLGDFLQLAHFKGW